MPPAGALLEAVPGGIPGRDIQGRSIPGRGASRGEGHPERALSRFPAPQREGGVAFFSVAQRDYMPPEQRCVNKRERAENMFAKILINGTFFQKEKQQWLIILKSFLQAALAWLEFGRQCFC